MSSKPAIADPPSAPHAATPGDASAAQQKAGASADAAAGAKAVQHAGTEGAPAAETPSVDGAEAANTSTPTEHADGAANPGDEADAHEEGGSDKKGMPTGINPSGKPNRRVHTRNSFYASAVLHEMDDQGQPGPDTECSAVDLSRGGIGVRLRKMLYPGRLVFVNLSFKDGEGRLFYGEVRSCRYHKNGLYHIGVQFERIPQRRFIERWMTYRGYKAA